MPISNDPKFGLEGKTNQLASGSGDKITTGFPVLADNTTVFEAMRLPTAPLKFKELTSKLN